MRYELQFTFEPMYVHTTELVGQEHGFKSSVVLNEEPLTTGKYACLTAGGDVLDDLRRRMETMTEVLQARMVPILRRKITEVLYDDRR